MYRSLTRISIHRNFKSTSAPTIGRSLPHCSRPRPLNRRCLLLKTRAAPLTEDDIRKLQQEADTEEEALIGEAWQQTLPEDLSRLYYDTEAAQQDFAEAFAQVKQAPSYKQPELFAENVSIPGVMAADLVGMGSWRLKGSTDPFVEMLTARIEGAIRVLLADDLAIYPTDRWKSHGWDFVDSIDPDREWDNWAWVDIPDPEKGEPGYPRMLIENRMYSSKVFRKIHLEVATVQPNLHVFHCVLYPRYNYDLPILAMDVVVINRRVTLALVDACPVRRNRQLPSYYGKVMEALQAEFLVDDGNQRRQPEWAADFMSPLCISITPQSSEELAGWLRYAVGLTKAHLALAAIMEPLGAGSRREAARLQEVQECHKRFCERNQQNTKTSRVLANAFTPEFADRYMREVMFDFDPSDEPPIVDGSISMFYDFMEATPPTDPKFEYEQVLENLDASADMKESVFDTLLPLLVDLEDTRHKFERMRPGLANEMWQFLYDADPEFRESADKVIERAGQLDERLRQLDSQHTLAALEAKYKKWYLP